MSYVLSEWARKNIRFVMRVGLKRGGFDMASGG